jgi:hypothetical protein
VLCADDEDRLMPTVRSRCARIRLGPVAARDVEAILADAGLADAPLAARLARLSAGRPGLSRLLALAPDAIAARDEIQRILLDLLDAGPAGRLAAARELTARATDVGRALDAAAGIGVDASGLPAAPAASGGRPRRRGGATSGAGRAALVSAIPASGSGDEPADDASAEALEPDDPGAPSTSASAAERRRSIGILVGLWRELARDLLVVSLGSAREVRDPALLDDLRTAARPDDARDVADFLARLDGAGELLEANVRPELILDSLLLAWPSRIGGTDGR